MNKLEKHLVNIENKLGSSEKRPSNVYDPLDWHLTKIESLIGGGGGGDLPTPPTEDGKYVLTVTVVNGKATYSWEVGGSGTELTPEAQQELLNGEF